MTFDDAQERLQTGKGSIRCDEVVSILESLGFRVEQRRRGKHYIFDHPGLPDDFWGSDFGCPHRRGDPVKKSYISKILGVLGTYEEELRAYLGENDE